MITNTNELKDYRAILGNAFSEVDRALDFGWDRAKTEMSKNQMALMRNPERRERVLDALKSLLQTEHVEYHEYTHPDGEVATEIVVMLEEHR